MILAISAAVTLIGNHYITQSYDREYAERGRIITGVITKELQHHDPGIVSDETAFANLMQGVVDTIMEISPEVEKISIYGPSGGEIRIIASTRRELIGDLADEEDIEPIRTGQSLRFEKTDAGRSGDSGSEAEAGQIEVLAPIPDNNGFPVASMGMYLSSAARESTLASQRVSFMAITSLVLFTMILALYLLLNLGVVRPIQALASAMRRIADSPVKNKESVPGISRGDEIGKLARAFGDLQSSLGEREEEIRLLLDASVAVSSALHVDSILQTLCNKIVETQQVTYCRVSIIDDSTGAISVRASYPTREIASWKNGVGELLDLSEAPYHQQVITDGEPLVVRREGQTEVQKQGEWEWMLTADTQSALFLPLITKDRIIGVVTLGEEREWDRTPFTADKVSFYHTLVNQAAVALENATLYEKAEWHVEELSTMHNISQAFTATLDYQEVISVVAKKVGDLFNAQFASVLMPDESSQYLNIVASYKLSAEYVWTINKKRRIPVGVGPIGRTFTEKSPFAVSDVATDSDYELWQSVANVQGYSALVALPLVSKGSSIGVICIYFAAPRLINQEELSLLSTIANEAAIAIENARMFENLQDAFVGTIRSLAETIDAKDAYTMGHSERVSLYSEAIARGLGISGSELQTIRYAGYLHDIGKIGIPDSILTKPGKLTAEEFTVIKKHPSLSERILRPVNFPFPVQSIVRHHHERFDGKGYPDTLYQEEIPLGARILFVADAFEAMTSDRPYRKALANQTAIDELVRNKGTQFDPRVVDAFIRIIGSEEEVQSMQSRLVS
ncbi:MAG: HD domain-containing phosphohydrolase [Thermoleophilia bacterium]